MEIAALVCHTCSRVLGVASMYDTERLHGALAGTRFAAFARLVVPSEIVERIVQVLDIQCTDCLKLSGVHHVTSEKKEHEESDAAARTRTETAARRDGR